MEVTLDGERLSAAEIEHLLAGSDGLALIRGRWVEVDRHRLSRILERFREVENTAADRGLGFAEAMRLVSGADISGDDAADCTDPDWSRVVAGPWLAEVLKGLRSPAAVLYGIGARLDEQPDLLFRLHRVDEKDLIARAGRHLPLAGKRPAAGKILHGDVLSEIFGLEMAGESKPGIRATVTKAKPRRRRAGSPGRRPPGRG